MRATTLSAFAIALAASGSAFAGLTVDGNLADWQINTTTWVSSLSNVHSTIEDSTGSGAYYLSPGWGGQAYDAEALYATIQGNKLFIALATGHNPLTAQSANVYAAGDFAIDFGKNGTYELGINVVNNFSGGLLGGVYSSPTWAYGLWTSTGAQTSDPSKVDKTPHLAARRNPARHGCQQLHYRRRYRLWQQGKRPPLFLRSQPRSQPTASRRLGWQRVQHSVDRELRQRQHLGRSRPRRSRAGFAGAGFRRHGWFDRNPPPPQVGRCSVITAVRATPKLPALTM